MNGSRSIAFFVLIGLLVLAGWFLLRNQPQATKTEETTGNSVQLEEFAEYQPSLKALPANGERRTIPLPGPAEGAIPGEFTVQFPNAEALEAFLSEADRHGLRILGTLPELLAVRVGGDGKDLQALLKDGASVDHNFIMEVPTMPDMALWEEANLAEFRNKLLEYLGIPDSPDHLTWGKGVTIAILDTGVIPHFSLTMENFQAIDLLASGSEGGIFGSHGTAVSGIIGSTDSFAPGVAPGSDILSVRVLDGNGQGDSFTLAQGIFAAVANGADIINMSLGGYGNSKLLQEAVQYATSEGVVLVAATGNDGYSRLTYPAAYQEVIAVTAVDAQDNRAPFANYGEGIDIAAPGYQIHALWENDEFIYFNGTSASSPVVAGIAARILQSGLADTPEEVAYVLAGEANDTGRPDWDYQYGAGIINAERIESIGQTGIYDLALADLYPAVEESNGSSFPLYVTLQNRGTDFIPNAMVELNVNGTDYFYRFSGLDHGEVDSVQVPIPEAELIHPFEVQAKVSIPQQYTDQRPANNQGTISLQRVPGENQEASPGP